MTANDNVYSTGYSNCFQVVSVLIVYGGNTTFFFKSGQNSSDRNKIKLVLFACLDDTSS